MLFEHGFYLTSLDWTLISLHDVARESVAALTDHFAVAFVRENVAGKYDVVATFENVMLTPFCLGSSVTGNVNI